MIINFSDILENGSPFCHKTMSCLEDSSLDSKKLPISHLETKAQSAYSETGIVLQVPGEHHQPPNGQQSE